MEENKASSRQKYPFGYQKLRGLRPVLSQKLAIIVFFALGIVLLILGIVFYVALHGMYEEELRYDDKCTLNSECTLSFHVSKKIKGKIFLKYKLTKFYQNHRRFGYSRVNSQLMGEYVDFQGMKQCDPYRSENDDSDPSKWILPCGVFANSVFNDSFTWLADESFFSSDDITLPVERDHVFKKLSSDYTTGNKWLEDNPIFNGQQNQHFIIWMRTSPVPTFSKVYAKCKDCTLEAGDYEIKIDNRYPASLFNGEKYIVIAREGTLGNKQTFLGIAFITLGCCCIVFSIIILLLTIFKVTIKKEKINTLGAH